MRRDLEGGPRHVALPGADGAAGEGAVPNRGTMPSRRLALEAFWTARQKMLAALKALVPMLPAPDLDLEIEGTANAVRAMPVYMAEASDV